MVQFAHTRQSLNIIAAVDSHPDLAGKSLGSVCEIDALEIPIAADLASGLGSHSAQVAIVTTVSSLVKLESLVAELAKAGVHIISTCEELLYPWKSQPKVAERIDRLCQTHGVVCLGTGINPGYLMEYLPTVLTGVCQSVTAVRVTRVQEMPQFAESPFSRRLGRD